MLSFGIGLLESLLGSRISSFARRGFDRSLVTGRCLKKLLREAGLGRRLGSGAYSCRKGELGFISQWTDLLSRLLQCRIICLYLRLFDDRRMIMCRISTCSLSRSSFFRCRCRFESFWHIIYWPVIPRHINSAYGHSFIQYGQT